MTGIDEAVAAHRAGDIGLAEHIYRELISAKRDLFHASHLLGLLHFHRGDLEEAKELIGRAIEIDPKDHTAHYHHGLVLNDLKHHEDALSSFDACIALDPNDPSAHDNRGVALRALNRLKDALSSFDASIALDPTFVEAYYNRGHALRDLLLYDLALASYDRSLALKPDVPKHWWLWRGVTLFALYRHDEAIAAMTRKSQPILISQTLISAKLL